MLVPSVIYAVKNFYLIDELNHHISNLKSAGLIEYWHSRIFDDSILMGKRSETPKILKFQHFIGAFQFWLVGMAVSTTAFVHEIVKKRE